MEFFQTNLLLLNLLSFFVLHTDAMSHRRFRTGESVKGGGGWTNYLKVLHFFCHSPHDTFNPTNLLLTMRELWCAVARERQPVHQEASSPQRRDIVSIRIQQSVDQVHGSTVLDFQVTYITVTVQPKHF